jgi:hypothetical protein
MCSDPGRYTDFTGQHCAGGSGSTLVISGATTSVTLKHCQFLCCSTAILSGASAVLEGCQFEGSIDSLAMLASSHGTQVALSSCTFTSWDEAVVVDGGAALEMYGGCQVTRICWAGVTGRGAGSRLSMTDVELLDVGYGSREAIWSPAAVAASNGAQVQLKKCTVANKKACAELGTSEAPDSCGLGALGQGTHAEAKDSEFQRCFHGVNVCEQATVHLSGCTLARNKDANVFAHDGAVVGLTGCTVADSLEGVGLGARDNGTRVDAKETTFQGNFVCGLHAWEHASVQLDKCSVTRNKDANVFAHVGAVVGLTGCTVADSLESSGLVAEHKGTRVDAKETTFQGNCEHGVYARKEAMVQLDKCSVTRNKNANVSAQSGAVVDLTGCTVADSLGNDGLAANGKGTRVDAKETIFQGNFDNGVAAWSNAMVQLDKCTAARNKSANVFAQSGAAVGLAGCTVADSLENTGLAAVNKGTRVDAKETAFQGSFLRGVEAWEHASVQLDKCSVTRNKDANVFAHVGAVVGLTGCTVADSLERSGLVAEHKGTRVDAKETTFQGNCQHGVYARKEAMVQLDNCTVTRNKRQDVSSSENAVVSRTGSGMVARIRAQAWMPRRTHSKNTS